MATIRLAPRAGFQLHSRQLQQRISTPHIRQASTNPPPKPRVLEKPDKFRPPSHPSRIRNKPRYTYGPDLSKQQRTKRYPHMMPAEGTTLHWFITNRTIHLWISMSVLFSLVVGMWLSDFLSNTPYRDLLPPNSMFFAHPFSFIGRWTEVYRMHVMHVSAQTAEMRKQKVEDAKKRSDFRKAHNLEQGPGILGAWTAKANDERPEAMPAGNADLLESDQANAVNVVHETIQNVNGSTRDSQNTVVDFEGEKRPQKKKWFGVW